jgi:NAD(P)-dependent dehydrogenase (short-subunit alcohol dehydrogenase family)
MYNLKDKVVVITGGTSGIGYAAAKAFKAQDARVIICGRQQESLSKASEELGVQGILADISNLSEIDQLVKLIKEEHQQVDALFVNAGVFLLEPVGSISDKNFDYQMDINFKGAVFTIEKFLPILKDGASVIALSSIAANAGTPNLAIYAASKAALNAYVKTAAIELAKRKIRINAINPGPTDTPIFSKLGFSAEQTAGIKEHAASQIPLGRLGMPEEIGNMVVYLASDSAAFITGAEFNIDGGMIIKA